HRAHGRGLAGRAGARRARRRAERRDRRARGRPPRLQPLPPGDRPVRLRRAAGRPGDARPRPAGVGPARAAADQRDPRAGRGVGLARLAAAVPHPVRHVPAILLSGVIWGLWHAPLTLLGYNYARLGAWAAPAFVGFCVIAGAVLAWLR